MFVGAAVATVAVMASARIKAAFISFSPVIRVENLLYSSV